MAPSARRAVLYGRVSKLSRAEQARAACAGHAEGRSVDQQLGELRRLADREHVHVVAEHRDDGISASRHGRAGREREGWRDTMALITGGEVTELWVWEISRATRDRPVWAALVSACIARKIMVTVQGRVHDPTDPDDGFMLDLQAALAVRESAVTSKRIKRDVRAAAAEGRPHGRIPYGYRRHYDPTTGALLRQEPDPGHAPIVVELFDRALAEHPLYTIARDLNDRGVPSPHEVRASRLGHNELEPYPWTAQLIHRLLRSPTYAGLRVHNEGGRKAGQRPTIVGPAAWPGLITRETWEHAQAILDQPTRNTRPADMTAKHLLSGIALCGVCGSPCRMVKNRGYPSYACWGPPERPGRSCVSRLQQPVDMYVTETVLRRLAMPDARAALVQVGDDERHDHVTAQRELAQLERRLEEFRASAENPEGISVSTLGRMERKYEPLIAAARARAVPRSVPAVLRRALEVTDVSEWWHEVLSMADRRELIRALVTVRILPSRKGARGFDPSLVAIAWEPARGR